MFALEDLAAITDSPELLQLLSVDLADDVREELNLLRSLTKLIPVALLCNELVVAFLLRYNLVCECVLLPRNVCCLDLERLDLRTGM